VSTFVPVCRAGPNESRYLIGKFDSLTLPLEKNAEHGQPMYVGLVFVGIGLAILASILAHRTKLRPHQGKLKKFCDAHQVGHKISAPLSRQVMK